MSAISTWIYELSAFSAPGEGVTRLPFTPEGEQAQRYLLEELSKLGLNPKIDRYGTIVGHMEGKTSESVMLGSHYDSIPNGGKYDGIVGIVTAMDAIRQLKENGITPNQSIDLICTNDEEGIRFSKGFLSARTICSLVDRAYLEDTIDVKSGVTLASCIDATPYQENEILSFKTALKNVRSFIEVHIEQGGILDEGGQEIGLVENIAGIRRFYVTVTGKGNHSGSTPMAGRKDALVVASRIIAKVPEMTLPYPKAVATVGNILCYPNSINAIPAQVQFSLDIRSGNEEYLKNLSDEICVMAKSEAEAAGVPLDIRVGTYVKAAAMSETILSRLEEIVKEESHSYLRMDSGAGHDAQTIADFVDTAMVFVPSVGGISHHPSEFSKEHHIQLAADLLYKYLK